MVIESSEAEIKQCQYDLRISALYHYNLNISALLHYVQRDPPVFLFVATNLRLCHWALLKRTWLLPLCIFPSGIYRY